MDKELTEIETLVMQAFSPGNPAMCVHQLFMATGIPYDKLPSVLGRLCKDGQLFRISSPLGGRDIVCTPTRFLDQVNKTPITSTDRCGLMIGLTEAEMMGRIGMLKRMKRLLISEWHPIINVLLDDYERNLHRLSALGEPVEAEETDDSDRLDEFY